MIGRGKGLEQAQSAASGQACIFTQAAGRAERKLHAQQGATRLESKSACLQQGKELPSVLQYFHCPFQ